MSKEFRGLAASLAPWTKTVPVSVRWKEGQAPLAQAGETMVLIIFIYRTSMTYLPDCPAVYSKYLSITLANVIREVIRTSRHEPRAGQKGRELFVRNNSPSGCRRWPRRAVRSGRTGRRGASARGVSLPHRTPRARPLDCSRGGTIHCATRFALIASLPPRTCHVRHWKPAIRRRQSFRIIEPWPPKPKAENGSPSCHPIRFQKTGAPELA